MPTLKLPMAICAVMTLWFSQPQAQAADAPAADAKPMAGALGPGAKQSRSLAAEPKQTSETPRQLAPSGTSGQIAPPLATPSDGTAGTTAAVPNKAAQDQMRKASPTRLLPTTRPSPQLGQIIGEKSPGADRVIGEKTEGEGGAIGKGDGNKEERAGGDRIIGEK